MDARGSDADIIVPFVPGPRSAIPYGGGVLDSAGQAIMDLLKRAAEKAEESSQHALDVARNLQIQLHAAEDRIKSLEIEIIRSRDRADQAENRVEEAETRAEQAEKWLHQISLEIERRFFTSPDSRSPQTPPRQFTPQTYARKK
jgi:DNA repair exonuclease SbcCD ATPase subunit